jgi:Amt family ammonium transporter
LPFDLSTINAGSTAWVLASAALVLLMTPGLAFFYGGMVRAKNVLGMLMQNFATIGIVSVVWVLISYSLAFGGDNAYLGGFHFTGLKHMDQVVPGYTGSLAQSVPPLAFVAFQLMFAIITPALITGGTADRWKFGPFVVFVVAWSILVYAPVAHWVFSPTGWLFKRGAEDFAGGTVVHANAGIAALAVILVLGKRLGWPKERFRPHNVPFVMLGAGLLWFGWFGFNAGSALGTTNFLSSYAFINTNTATAAALLSWILVEKIRDGKPTTLGAASGAVAGLVAITPAAGFVSPMGSVAIGLIAGAVCCLAVALKFKLKFDDSLDVVAVHLIGGISGALLIGFFGDAAVSGRNGVINGGGWGLLGEQALDVISVIAYSFVATLIIAFVIDLIFLRKMKMSDEQQLEGMDSVLHGETAYEFGPSLGSSMSGTLVGSSVGSGGGARPNIPASGGPIDETSVGDKTGVDA